MLAAHAQYDCDTGRNTPRTIKRDDAMLKRGIEYFQRFSLFSVWCLKMLGIEFGQGWRGGLGLLPLEDI